MAPSDHDLMLAADRVKQVVQGDASFVQLALEGPGLVLAFVGDPAPEVQAQVLAAARGVTVRYRQVSNSRGELDRVREAISSAWEDWRAKGIEIRSVGGDWATNTVLVELITYSDDAVYRLREAYGPDIVTVAPGNHRYARRC